MEAPFRRWTPVVAWCLFIFFLSSQPHLPGPVDQNWDFIIKKLGHITAYAILFGLTFRAICHPERPGTPGSRRIVFFKTFVFCVLYALSDEWHQSFVPGRTPMLRDVGIDIIGMCLWYFFSGKVSIFLSRHGFRIKALEGHSTR